MTDLTPAQQKAMSALNGAALAGQEEFAIRAYFALAGLIINGWHEVFFLSWNKETAVDLGHLADRLGAMPTASVKEGESS